MSYPTINKAGLLYIALKNNKGILAFKNCLYSYFDDSSLLVIKDPIHGMKGFRKSDVDEAYIGKIGSCELRAL